MIVGPLARKRQARRVVRRSPSVFTVRSTDGTYEHTIVLMPIGTLKCDCQAAPFSCWAAIKVAKYLLRNPQRIEESLS
jgi:hypothetical protein